MRRVISEFVEQIILQSALGGGINCTLNRVLQVSRESRDMGVIDAGIGGNLIAAQLAAFPGTVEWMPQDRSLANQIIQSTQGFFGFHRRTMLRRLLAGTQVQKISSACTC